ncbi:unnamed protein product [Ambrosiozyma monospora]|uniref:Unnamed protein product n=1 Tax=Ambrosiozyma monospora TaxID=43982 RepID=A0ACB5SY45_AMBMO|nr:unnamed protein product [Ambrosiozyma monospora]
MIQLLTKVLFIASTLSQLVYCINSSPAILYNHQLVPGLKKSLIHSEQLPFSKEEAHQIITSTFEQCLSDVYVIVNIPGLRLDDFHHFQSFPFLRESMTKASTLVSMPNILFEDDEHLELDDYVKTLRIHCKVLVKEVNNDDPAESGHYTDTRARLFKLNLIGLHSFMTEDQRIDKLLEYDELLKEVLRKTPSPNNAVLFTTTTTTEVSNLDELNDPNNIIHSNQIPNDPKQITPGFKHQLRHSMNSIFPDITILDKTRYFEYERNPTQERNLLKNRDIPDGMWAKDAVKVEPANKEDDTWNEKKVKKIVKEEKLYKYGEETKHVPAFTDNAQYLFDNAALTLLGVSVILCILLKDVLVLIFKGLKSLFSQPNSVPPTKTAKKD